MKNILRNSNFGFKNRIMRMALLRSEPRRLGRSFGGLRASLLLALTAGWIGAAQTYAARLAAWDFTGETSPATSTADVFDASLDSSSLLTRGPGAASSSASNSFRTTGFQNNGIATANTDYFQFTLSVADGKILSLTTIDAKFGGTSTFYATPGVTSQFAYSLNGITFTLIGSPVTSTSLTLTQINLAGISDLQSVPAGSTVTFRYYASGQTATGGWGFAGSYGLDIGGTISSASAGAPTISSPLTKNAVAYDSSFSYQIQANNSPTSYNATPLPSGLRVDTTTGIISGTPTTPGNYNITISAINGSGSGSATLVLDVTKNSLAPTITSPLTTTASVGQTFSYQIGANNSPTGYAASNLPAGLQVNATTGIISGTPTAAGTSSVTITASNSLGLDSQTLVLTISAPPTITSSTSGSIYGGGTFSYTIAATATPAVTAYGATGLPAGWTIDAVTGAISGTSVPVGTYNFTVSATNDAGTGSATYTLKVLSQAEQDAIPLNVVINKYVNASPDKVELLVVGDGTAGSTVDMRGMIIKDTSSSMANDSGGRFIFANNALWQSVPAGTLIVLTAGNTATEDVTIGSGDFNLALNLANPTYFTASGSFDIATTEMVVIKAAGTGVDGVAGGIHSLAGGTAAARYTEFSGKKLRATGTSATSNGVYANNDNSVLADYYLADGTGATGGIASTALTFGSFNTAGNDSFIKTLRGVVDGSGIASIVNGLSGSVYLGKNVFPRNQLGQMVEVVFTPSSTAAAIQQLEIEVPVAFGVPTFGNVTISGTGTGSASPGVVGQKVTISGLNAISPNPVTIRIAGLSCPDTSDAVTNNGSYTFNIRSAGVGGSLAALGVSPTARVIIPIANLKNVDATTRVPVLSGQTVAVEGVCLVGRLGSGSTSTVLQEGNSGVQVNSLSTVLGPQTRGNKYTAVGAVGQSAGVTQITMTDASLMFNQGADVLPTPAVVTIPVFNANPETYENRLIRIENLTYVSGTFGTSQSIIFQDASNNPLTIRIQAASTATLQPNGTVSITGIGGQFDTTSPYDSGYQLQPRDLDDMPAPPSITTTTFSGTVGQEFSRIISTSGMATITADVALPAGLSLDSATGSVTGTPTAAATSGLVVGFTASNTYGNTKASITFTIQKGTSSITTVPTATAIRAGQALSASVLSGGEASVAGAFDWTTPSTLPATGTATHGVTFTPMDTANYNTATTTVSVTVNPAPVGTTYNDWLQAQGATPSDPNAAMLDYAFGATTLGALDPTRKPSVAIVPPAGGAGGDTATLVLTYYVRQNAVGLTVTPNLSLDLSAVDGGFAPLDPTQIEGHEINDLGGGVSVQRMTASVPMIGDRKFLKLEVLQQ